jgi:hypothetical protein
MNETPLIESIEKMMMVEKFSNITEENGVLQGKLPNHLFHRFPEVDIAEELCR